MKHGYLVLDNDAPLYICTSRGQAEQVVAKERESIERTITLCVRNQQLSLFEEPTEIQNRLNAHHLHWVMVPYAITKE